MGPPKADADSKVGGSFLLVDRSRSLPPTLHPATRVVIVPGLVSCDASMRRGAVAWLAALASLSRGCHAPSAELLRFMGGEPGGARQPQPGRELQRLLHLQ